MPGTTTVLGLTTITGADTPAHATHFSVGISDRVEAIFTGAASPAGSITLAFGTITANRGVRTTQTWNAGGVTFKALEVAVTLDTASAADSLLADFLVGGSSQWKVTKGGAVTQAGALTVLAGNVTLPAAKVFIGDTADGDLTVGLVINQGTNDDNAISLKSSDVSVTIAGNEEDTYGRLRKASASLGGLRIDGFNETTQGVMIFGWGSTDDTNHNASGNAYVEVEAVKMSAGSAASPGANANLFAVRDGSAGATKFIVDTEGNFFSDDTGSTYDAYDDLALVEAFDVRREFGAWRSSRQDLLVGAGIIAPDGARGERGFVNWTNLLRLHNGAFRQLAGRLESLEARVTALLEAN